MRTFAELVAEGRSVPVEGWDFSWFEGRASEVRPSWGYSRMLAARMASVSSALDVQTGGGEVLAGAVLVPPPRLVATESWPPNAALASSRVRLLGGHLVVVDDAAPLPFANSSFDLVVSRHPTVVRWAEIARVLRRGGAYLSQQVGAGSVRELTDAMMGPQPVSQSRAPERAVAGLTAAGLQLVDLQDEWLRMEFFDVAAVIVFLRKVIWIVPGFDVDAYLQPLARVDRQIRDRGPFVAHARRFLIDARKPAVSG